MASLQELKQTAWKMGSQLFEPIVRATASSVSKHIIEAIVPVSSRDLEVIANLTPTSPAIQAFIATQSSLDRVQQQQKELEEADSLLKTKIARENFALYRENLAQNWDIAQQNLARQSELYCQERKIKLLLSELWNNLKLESQQVELQQQNDLDAWQIRVDGETSLWLNIFSNRELEIWAEDSQRPLFICAKMQITDGCPDYFRTELPAETESQIKIFVNTVFKKDVRYYSRFFESEEIFEINVVQLQDMIPHIPCVLCWRKVTRRTAYFHYQLWGSQSAQMLHGHLDIEVPWRDLLQQLQTELAEEALEEDDFHESISDWLIAFQKIYTLFAIELYSLVDGENPFYTVKLGTLNLGLPEEIARQFIAPLAKVLQQIQERRIQSFNEVLHRQQEEVERQRQEELQRQQKELRRQQEEAERQRQEELQRQEEEAARREVERQRLARLVSVRGMESEYQKLDEFLTAKQWWKADELTCKLMLRVANRTARGWLNEDSIKTFPGEDLKTIDGLWVEGSQGNFGFSVQKKLWQECGGKVGEYDYEAYKKFAEKVGWYHLQNDTWLTYNEFAKETNDGENALPGSFPVAVTLGVGVGWGLVVYLLSHRSF